ncbi:hypothetical protein M408DRAFT_68691 [Serendipita vermifera MAFF 305830]|uniref:SET domain-containing protein n=1 Tax=Serendipita vermifera MAFF 305830 TaxID=933852 RepID=A0A0C3BCH3_SERVB|nr:hypothetical protein M408DRAFT_68691 [Serendipita vermifera MAFF 305830]
MGRVPKNWPNDIQYIENPVYHSSVPSNGMALLKSAQPNERGITVMASPSEKWTHIERISTTGHPACGQLGLFASKKIPPHTMVLWYLGQVHGESRNSSDYDLSLIKTSDGINIGVDAQFQGNEARCLNDYRGIAERPNAVFKEGRTERGELRMSVWTGSKAVIKGQELLVSYGKGWWSARRTEAQQEA